MSWSQEELVAAAYGVVFVFVLVYVAIIAAKLVRLQRETAELAELARSKAASRRTSRRVAGRERPQPRLCCARARRRDSGKLDAVTRPLVVARPLPLQAPTAFVRIRPPVAGSAVRRVEHAAFTARPARPARP